MRVKGGQRDCLGLNHFWYPDLFVWVALPCDRSFPAYSRDNPVQQVTAGRAVPTALSINRLEMQQQTPSSTTLLLSVFQVLERCKLGTDTYPGPRLYAQIRD